MHKVDIELEHHRHQAQDGRNSGQQHWPQALGSGPQNGFDDGHAATAQDVEGIDQYNVVVDHDTGQGNDTNPAHDDTEGLAGRKQSEKHPDGREDHSSEDEKSLIETVELGHQDDSHHKQGYQEGLAEEGLRFALLLILALESNLDSRVHRLGIFALPLLNLRDLRCRQYALRHIRLYRHYPLAVHTADGTELLSRSAGNEITDRHQAVVGLHPQAVELVQVAIPLRQTDDDIHLVVSIVRAVIADLDAVGHHLYSIADYRDVGTKTGCLGTIDTDLPLYARQRPVILHINEATDFIQHLAYLDHRRLEQLWIARTQLELHRFAYRRSSLLLADFDNDAGDIAGTLAHLREDGTGWAPQLPIGEFHLDHTDGVLRQVLAAQVNATARVESLNLLHVEQTLFDPPYQRILLVYREIAAGTHMQHCPLRLNIGEKLHPFTKRTIGTVNAYQQQHGNKQDLERMGQEALEQAHIHTGKTTDLVQLPLLRGCKAVQRFFAQGAAFTQMLAQDRNEDQRHQQRS